MSRSFIFAGAVGLVLATGCFGPVKAPESRAAIHRKAALEGSGSDSNGPNRSPAAFNVAGDGPLTELIVKGTVLKASDIWSRNRSDLDQKRSQLPPRDFFQYVQRESAKLINDRLGEVLLYEEAALRMPEGVDSRIEGHVDAEIRKIVSTEHNGVQHRYERALAAKGQTLTGAREEMRRQVTITAYLDQEFRPLIGEPTRDELLAVFEENKDKWQRPARRKMSLIDIRVRECLPDGVDAPTRAQTEAAKLEAQTIAAEIVESLRVGKSFAEMARRSSHGLHAEDGGAWGWVEQGTLRERFTPALDALYRIEEDAVEGPIETPDGYFIVRCDQIDPGYDPDFQTVQPQLQDEFLRSNYGQLVTEHVAELREKSGINVRTLERFHRAVVEAVMAEEVGPPAS